MVRLIDETGLRRPRPVLAVAASAATRGSRTQPAAVRCSTRSSDARSLRPVPRSFRAAVPEDAPVLAALFHAAVHALPDALYGPAAREAWAPTPPDAEAFARRIRRAPPLLALEDGQPVGFMTLEPDGHLDLAYVHPDHQRRGVASALHARLLEDARRAGLARVHTEASRAARPFFEARGWVARGVEAVERAGVPLERWRMDQRLRSFREARRVFLVGNSAAGKSTLAARLARALGRPRVDLDEVAFLDQQGTRRPLADSCALVEARPDAATAIIEGCYADLIEALAGPRDHLVWLDLDLPRCLEHARARPWEPHKWPSAEAQDAFLPKLLAFIASYPERDDPTGRPAHAALFERFPGARERHDTRPPEGSVETAP